MTNHPTALDDHDPFAHDILRVLEAFIDEIGKRKCTEYSGKVVDGKFYLKGKHLIFRGTGSGHSLPTDTGLSHLFSHLPLTGESLRMRGDCHSVRGV